MGSRINEDASPYDCPVCMEAFTAAGERIPYFLLCACSNAQSMCMPCMDGWKQRSDTCPHCRDVWGQKKLRNGNLIWILEQRQTKPDESEELKKMKLEVNNTQAMLEAKRKEARDLIRKLQSDKAEYAVKDRKMEALETQAAESERRSKQLIQEHTELASENLRVQKKLSENVKSQKGSKSCIECDGKARFRCATCPTEPVFCEGCFAYAHKYIPHHVTKKI